MARKREHGAASHGIHDEIQRLTIAGALLGWRSASPAFAQKINWRLTTYVPEGNQDYREYIELYVKNVELLTGGEIKIQPFGAGVLAPPFEGPQAVQKGIADMTYFFPAFMVNQDPANAFLAGLPGGMSAEATMAWLFHGGGEKLWVDFRREKMNLHAVVSGIGPSEIFAHSHKPIRVAEDLKGLKFRTTGAWAAILKDYFGVSPTVLPASEIFTALERRVIDGTEYVTPSINLRDRIAQRREVCGVARRSSADLCLRRALEERGVGCAAARLEGQARCRRPV